MQNKIIVRIRGTQIKLKDLKTKIKLRAKIYKVEKRVLKFKLYNWQKDYILNKDVDIPFTRASGKTLAYDLKFILRDDVNICLVLPGDNLLYDEPSIANTMQYRVWHMKEMADLYNKIKEAKIKVRPIRFVRR